LLLKNGPTPTFTWMLLVGPCGLTEGPNRPHRTAGTSQSTLSTKATISSQMGNINRTRFTVRGLAACGLGMAMQALQANGK